MKRLLFLTVILLLGWQVQSQQMFHVEIDPFQEVDLVSGAIGSRVSVPDRIGTAVLAGGYDLEGLGRILIFNGTQLRIENMTMGPEGYAYVQLRRQDGRNFFDKFPLLKARLIPVEQNLGNEL